MANNGIAGDEKEHLLAKNEKTVSKFLRNPSSKLIIPGEDTSESHVVNGVDMFQPTYVSFHAKIGLLRWDSRSHRKSFTTVHPACSGKKWRIHSFSYWIAGFGIIGAIAMIFGASYEIVYHFKQGYLTANQMIFLTDIPILLGSSCFLLCNYLTYLEVLNSCHNLEMWLLEYLDGKPVSVKMKYWGFYGKRIDYWLSIFGMTGSFFYVATRLYILLGTANPTFGIANIPRNINKLIWCYWVPFTFGSICLLIAAYLSHVEVSHSWISMNVKRLDNWITCINILSAIGFFLSCVFQFIDPFDVDYNFVLSITPYWIGAAFLLIASVLSVLEQEALHKQNMHPHYNSNSFINN